MRPEAEWCSLCYQDLRTPAAATTRESRPVNAPLVEASLEPGPVRWAELRAWHGGVADEAELDTQSAERPAKPVKDGASEALSWPCGCGTSVAFDHDACPVCGSPFLGELRGESSGRHRVGAARSSHASQGPGAAFAERWSSSRAFRFAVAGVISLLIAVGIPIMLTLLG